MNDQRPLNDQLKDLAVLAVKAGLYDAADWVNAQIAPKHLDRSKTRNQCWMCKGSYAHTDEQHIAAVRYDATIHDMRSYEAELSTRAEA